ncbi:XRE family transcriptional regulator [Nostoc sp. FACHB-280]|uniref:XRE family transcriptional regulator n=1 Tax=Nostoc sp. FACHB-280 TaxID=2692839 RepID=UPI00168BD893|nr:XRE family transcriptional regulator [Nostoc sp. FACHB-280]MBD2497893.1 XRE family transcriptional regulator [Nostoc sp. FACHB-280]
MLASNNGRKIITMIDIEHIATFKWGNFQAEKLAQLRGNMSRRQLEQKTVELGQKVAHQYIQQLEQPDYYATRLKSGTLTVSTEVVNVLCQALNADITDFFDTAKIVTVVA